MSKGLSLDDYLGLLMQGVEDVRLCLDGGDRSALKANRLQQLALAKALDNIGETAGDILAAYPDFAHNQRDIDWRAWKGTRNRLCHGYHSIDYDLVWGMAERDAPALGRELQEIFDFDRLMGQAGLSGPSHSR